MEFLKQVLVGAGDKLQEDLHLVPLRTVDESVFRYHFLSSAYSLCEKVDCQIEWKRIDLILQRANSTYAIEFKFYGDGIAWHLDGKKKWRKGGPGKQNQDEFFSCVRKLKELEGQDYIKKEEMAISGKFLVLGYYPDLYNTSYDSIDYPPDIAGAVESEWEGPTITKNEKGLISTKLIKVGSYPY